jgi:hypothetical protein
MSRGFGALQRPMLKTMEAPRRYELPHGALVTPLCRRPRDHRFVRQWQSRISTQLLGNEASTGAIAAKPGVSARGTAPGLRHHASCWGSHQWYDASLRGLRIEFAYQGGPHGLPLRGPLGVDPD